MTTYFEDTDPDLIDTERAFVLEFPDSPKLNKLFRKLRDNILTQYIPHAAYRAILVEASSRELGVVMRDFWGKGILDVEFKSRTNLLDLDTTLRPYYGAVIPALNECYELGLEHPYGEQWLEYFRKDNGVYRVNMVCCMCAAGGLLRAGNATRLGPPSQLALSSRPQQIANEKDTEDYRYSIFVGGTGTLEASIYVT